MTTRNAIASTALLAIASVFGLASHALAADLLPTTKGPPPAPPVVAFTWTGFYIGGYVGAGADNDQFHFIPADTRTFNSADSVLGGVRAGYNYQTSWAVLGVEGDFGGMHLESHNSCPNPFFTCGHENDWVGTLLGRVGVAPIDRSLLYVAGGGAVSDFRYTALPPGVAPFVFSGRFSQTEAAWVIGGGFEYAFTNNWSFDIEYLHYGFGDVTAAPGTLSAANSTRLSNSMDTVDVGINYHF
jgi:outer membrane immunogenic protein